MRGEPLRRQNALELLNSCTDPIGQTPDLLWVIRRMICREGSVLPHELSSNCTEQLVPFWSGFFSTLADFKPDRTIVAYGPIIDNKPSDMATVFTAMHNCQNLATTLGQKHAIQTMDQQLYAVAQQVKWSLKDKFADHIIRLGGFHALSCFIAAVGKLWSEAGLKDLLVDSGVYAGTTAEQMLSGKQFNRAVRGLTLVYEALMHVLLSQFFQCSDLEDRLADVPKHLWSRMKEANLQFESSACSGNSQPVDNLTETFTQRGKVYEANRSTTLHISSPWFICTAAIVLLQHGVDPNLYSFGDILCQLGEHCMFSRQEDYCIDGKIFLATFVSSGYDLTISDMNCYENDYFQSETDYHLLKDFGRPPSLKHLARTQIRKHIRFINMDTSVFPIIDKLKLPTILKDYLKLFDGRPADISPIVCYEHRR
ncbi:unnamed protein product [Mytilus edulis]|uniref:SOCS box domain-containing protein n=1 Tax=Mytilus edulis TaxID=6550 RepID=A0A8S3U658_MYTED|nr:unnamed protein product [Mytilus edulis]